MKKLLMILGTGALLTIGAIVALLFWAQRAGAELQDKFYHAVVSGDPQQVLALCDPALREQIDAPVLGAWMNAVKAKLGNYQGLSKANFNTSMNSNAQGSFIESKGTVEFENGTATSELTFRNNLLTAFSIESDKLAGGWFQGPTDTKLYRDRGEEFIKKFFAKDHAGCTAMMGKELRDMVPDDRLTHFMTTILYQFGPLKKVTYRDEKLDKDDLVTLRLYYEVEAEKGPLNADVKFQFPGLQGVLEGFNFEPKE